MQRSDLVPSRARRSWLVSLLLVLIVASLPLGCGVGRRGGRPSGSAVWLAAGEVLSQADASAFGAIGIGEVFVESVRVAPAGEGLKVTAEPLAQVPPGTAVMLVVRGEVTSTSAGKAGAEALATELKARRAAAGWLVRGVHLDVDASLAVTAQFASSVRDALDDDLLLSSTLPPTALDPAAADAAEELVDATDFVVPFLYGQRVGAEDEPDRWDLQALERDLDKVDALGERYLLGVVTVGTAAALGDAGEVVDATANVTSLREPLVDRRLELQAGFSLAGVDRQVYVLHARTAAAVGALAVERGQDVRLVRLATVHLQRLRAALAEPTRERNLGVLYWRLPKAGEGLSLSVANLVAGASDTRPVPQLEVAVEQRGKRRAEWTLGVELANRNDEPTDLATLDHNYVELQVRNGHFRAAVPGQFQRVDFLAPGVDGELERTFRSPTVVRFYQPILAGHDVVTSGDVILVPAGSPVVTVSATFLLPDGEMLELEPQPWTPGQAGTKQP